MTLGLQRLRFTLRGGCQYGRSSHEVRSSPAGRESGVFHLGAADPGAWDRGEHEAFSILNRLMLQSLPFHDPSSLVQVWSTSARDSHRPTAPADYFDVKEQASVFVDIAAYQLYQSMSYAETGKAPIQVSALYMTDNFFSVLGLQPQLGRLPNAEESRTLTPVTLISDWFWRQQLGADPNVLGRSVRLNSRPSTVVGVMPPSVDEPTLFNNRPAFFYLDPVTHSRAVRKAGWYSVLARLKPGLTIKQAQGEMNVIAQRLAHDYPDTNKDRGWAVVPYPTNQLGEEGVQLTWMTLALSGLVLLIACINLANLQLVRTTRRAHEIAIRLSLGCSRGRLVGMLLLESLIISTLGGALGIMAAIWSNGFVARYLDIDLPLNLRVIAFAFLVSLITGAFFGVIPAWLATRGDSGAILKSGGRAATSDRSRHWLRQSLIAIELALALTLLAGAGFFISGIFRLTHRELGWDTSHEVLAVVTLDQDHYWGDEHQPQVLAFGDRALEELRAIPGVQAATLSSGSPSWGGRGALPRRGSASPGARAGTHRRVFQRQPRMVRVLRHAPDRGPTIHGRRSRRLRAGRDRERIDGSQNLAWRISHRQTYLRRRYD